jgi:hypothetical protein
MIKTVSIVIEHDTDYPGEVLICLKHGVCGCMDYGLQKTSDEALETLLTASYEAMALIEDYDSKGE